jgi:hypothetical protein
MTKATIKSSTGAVITVEGSEEEVSRILSAYEKCNGVVDANEAKRVTRRQAISVGKTKKKTLSDHILELRGKAVFSEPQTTREVHEKLQSSYPCLLNRVEVELPRMVARKQLRKASKTVNGKTQAAYVW